MSNHSLLILTNFNGQINEMNDSYPTLTNRCYQPLPATCQTTSPFPSSSSPSYNPNNHLLNHESFFLNCYGEALTIFGPLGAAGATTPFRFRSHHHRHSIEFHIPIQSSSKSPTTHDPPHLRSQSPVPWSTGLCDCFDDLSTCCLTCWCPCVAFGRIAEIVDRGSTSCGVSGALYALILCVTGCSCFYSCFYRSKLRGQYFLEESPCTDCFIHCCCEECALCQEYRELKNHGFDMSIGGMGMWRDKAGLKCPQ